MRARNLFAAGLITAIAACSGSSEESTPAAESDVLSELELGYFDAAVDGSAANPVLSPLELGTPAAPEGTTSSAPVARAPSPADGQAVARFASLESRVAMAEPALAAPVEESEIAGPVTVPDRGATGHGAHEGEDHRPLAGVRPGIIIRGGLSGRDPCAIHLPGAGRPGGLLGGVGVAINDRAPRGVGIGGVSYPNRGGSAAPRRGSSFPGGIR